MLKYKVQKEIVIIKEQIIAFKNNGLLFKLVDIIEKNIKHNPPAKTIE